MHKYTVKITDSAISDIEELANFYLELVDADSAARFSEDAIATIENLQSFPQGHAYWDKTHNLRRTNLKHHKVTVIFTVDNDVFEVIAIGSFHSLNNPTKYHDTIIDRLRKTT